MAHIFTTLLSCSCDMCNDGLVGVVQAGTGQMLHDLFLALQRTLEGSDVAALRVGTLSPHMAMAILKKKHDPHQKRPQEFLDEFFPGVNAIDHVKAGHLAEFIVPLLQSLMISSQPLQMLACLYDAFLHPKATSVPPYVREAALVYFLFLSGLTSLNPNMSWILPANFLLSDTLIFFDTILKEKK